MNQKTAWKMGHAIRELMDDRNLELAPLDEVVEVDEAYIGDAPKTMFNANVKAEQEGKPLVLVAVTRDGQARVEVVQVEGHTQTARRVVGRCLEYHADDRRQFQL